MTEKELQNKIIVVLGEQARNKDFHDFPTDRKTSNLDLPICPKCNNTKNVEQIKKCTLLTADYITALWFKCKQCKIKWNASLGISYSIPERWD